MSTTIITILLIVLWSIVGQMFSLRTVNSMTQEEYRNINTFMLFLSHILYGPVAWSVLIFCFFKTLNNRSNKNNSTNRATNKFDDETNSLITTCNITKDKYDESKESKYLMLLFSMTEIVCLTLLVNGKNKDEITKLIPAAIKLYNSYTSFDILERMERDIKTWKNQNEGN